MAASVRTIRVAAITAGSTQDVTISGFGTPEVAIVKMYKVTTDGTVTGDAGIATGLFAGGNAVCSYTRSTTGGASSSCGRGNAYGGTDFIRTFDYAGDDDSQASVSFITDGIRLSWSLLPPAGWLMSVTLMTGTEAALCGYIDTSGGDVDVTSLGARPSLIYTSGADTGSFPSANFDIAEGYAVETSPGVVVQHSMTWFEANNGGNCSPMVNFQTAQSRRNMAGAGLQGGIEWKDFDADGATAGQIGTGSDSIVLMVTFPSDQEVGIFSDSVTTSTGSTVIGPGGSVVPGFIAGAFAASTPAQDDTWLGNSGDPEAGVVSMFSYDGTTQICGTLFLDEGTDPVVTASVSNSGAVFDSADDDQSNAWVGTASGFTAGGMTVSVTTAPATERRIFGWYLEAASGGGVSGAVALVAAAGALSMSGAVAVSGTFGGVAPAAAMSLAGNTALSGVASLQAAAAALQFAGGVQPRGALVLSAAPGALAMAGGIEPRGALALSASPAALSVAGSVAPSGSLVALAPAAALSVSGNTIIEGTAQPVAAPAALSAAGNVLVSGTVDASAPAATLTASGGALISGSAALAPAPAALGLAGNTLIEGTLSALAPAGIMSADSNNQRTGMLTLLAPGGAIALVGETLLSGAVGLDAAAAALAVAGNAIVEGQLALLAAAGSLSFVADNPRTGALALLAPAASVALGGELLIEGVAFLLAPAGSLVTAGETLLSGQVALLAPPGAFAGSISAIDSEIFATLGLVAPAASLSVAGATALSGVVSLLAPAGLMSLTRPGFAGPLDPVRFVAVTTTARIVPIITIARITDVTTVAKIK